MAEPLRAILGEGYVMHAHRALHTTADKDQGWHKDSYWGVRRMRHHRPRWAMAMCECATPPLIALIFDRIRRLRLRYDSESCAPVTLKSRSLCRLPGRDNAGDGPNLVRERELMLSWLPWLSWADLEIEDASPARSVLPKSAYLTVDHEGFPQGAGRANSAGPTFKGFDTHSLPSCPHPMSIPSYPRGKVLAT